MGAVLTALDHEMAAAPLPRVPVPHLVIVSGPFPGPSVNRTAVISHCDSQAQQLQEQGFLQPTRTCFDVTIQRGVPVDAGTASAIGDVCQDLPPAYSSLVWHRPCEPAPPSYQESLLPESQRS